MKKILSYVLAVYFLLLLGIPGYFVYRHYNTLYTGDGYKFVVEPYDPYDPFRGRYVALRPEIPLYGPKGEYGVLEQNGDGYGIIREWTATKPSGGQYVKDMDLSRYYMNEKQAPRAERLRKNIDFDGEGMYLMVYVKQGHYVIEGLYVNDTPIEEYLDQKEDFSG